MGDKTATETLPVNVPRSVATRKGQKKEPEGDEPIEPIAPTRKRIPRGTGKRPRGGLPARPTGGFGERIDVRRRRIIEALPGTHHKKPKRSEAQKRATAANFKKMMASKTTRGG